MGIGIIYLNAAELCASKSYKPAQNQTGHFVSGFRKNKKADTRL